MQGQININVGTAGWSNPPAKKLKRDADQTHLQFYARHFNCVEINSSFYRAHKRSTYARWRDDTPEAFRFSVKMPRAITHESGLTDCASEVSQFYEDVVALQPKLRIILVQVPPSLEFDPRNARAFFASLPRLSGVAVACEPRHASWFTGHADDELREAGVARVAADPARCSGADRPGGWRRLAYFRWHGAPHMYYSSYSKTRLEEFEELIHRVGAVESWCVFDNTARHAAWDNARHFMAGLESVLAQDGAP